VVSSVIFSIFLLHKQSFIWTFTSWLTCQFSFEVFE
jgi:hypothetical protein